VRILYLGRRAEVECLVSDEDYDFLSQWLWSWSRSKRNRGDMMYAKRTVTVRHNGTRTSKAEYVHHVVLRRMGEKRPTPKHTADHINRKKLDCQRPNLRWATKRQQEANKDKSLTANIAKPKRQVPDTGLNRARD